MRFGACVDYVWISELEAAGFDYLEFVLSRLATMEEEEYQKVCEAVEGSSLKIEACNGFFPAGIQVTGPEVDYEKVREYAETAMARAAKVGCKIAVLGSGGARRVPENFDFAEAYEQFGKVLKICGDAAARYGITIALEPLRRAETNFINTVEEGLALCKKVNHPHVKCLADFYHVFCNEESLKAIKEAGEWLVHAHLARANIDRHIPYEGDREACETWAAALKECGYDARISLEGKFEPDIPAALQRAREILKVFEA